MIKQAFNQETPEWILAKLTGKHHCKRSRAIEASLLRLRSQRMDDVWRQLLRMAPLRSGKSASAYCWRTLQGHERVITSAAFSHNGRYLVTGSQDTTAGIWDVNDN
jgi:WD40 repeat protein